MSVEAVLYFLALAVWSGVIAYLLLFKVLLRSKEKPAIPHAPAVHAPAPQPAVPSPTPAPRRSYSSHDGFRSLAKGAELTVEDIVKGLSGGK